jgi:membrane protein
MAAQLSYYSGLALFPALLFLLALSSFFSLSHLTDDVTAVLGPLVSPQIVSLIQEQMRRLADADDGGLMTVGVLGAMWGSSSALVAIVTAVNRAYDLQETRPWWKVRLIAVALTSILALLLIAAVSLIMAGPGLAAALGVSIESQAWIWTWNVVRWPAAFALVAFAIGMVYNYAPDADQDWLWVTPGAVAATALWLIASVGFKFYIATFTDYEGTYGAVGGIIILLLWLYISGLGILVGAELNSEIEHATAHGQTPLTNTAGRRVIGRRAGRLFEAHEAAKHADSAAVRPAAPPAPRPHMLPGAVFASAVLILRGSRRMLRARP